MKKMKKYIFYTILSFLIATSVSARKTGCDGNCENGFGKWTYTDKTTYEGNWVGTQKHGQGIETWPNATNLTYGFMVKITSSLSSTGCGSSNRFSVKYGDFQDQTLSILLAAMMANKKSESMSMSVLIDLLSIELK